MAVLCDKTFFSFRVKSWKTSGLRAFSDTAFCAATGAFSGAAFEQHCQRNSLQLQLDLIASYAYQRYIFSKLLRSKILL